MRLGVAALPTQRPISKGHSPYRSGSAPRSSSSRADEARGACELVEREQAQGVAHDDAHPGAPNPVLTGVAQSSKYHREGGESEICFRLAAAGREEEKVHGLAVRIEGVCETGKISAG